MYRLFIWLICEQRLMDFLAASKTPDSSSEDFYAC
jgi:hypothetical protein